MYSSLALPRASGRTIVSATSSLPAVGPSYCRPHSTTSMTMAPWKTNFLRKAVFVPSRTTTVVYSFR